MIAQQIKNRLSQISPKSINTNKKAAVMLILCNDPLEIVYTVRSKELKNHPGEVSFPGGMQENNESMVETAVRETEEEIGLKEIEILGDFYNVKGKSGVGVSTIVGYKPCVNIEELNLNPDEVSKAFLVPIHNLVFQDKLKIRTYFFKKHVIWGLTGFITNRFIGDVYKETEFYKTLNK